MKKAKKARGGKRAGSGRPALFREPLVPCTINLPPDAIKFLDAWDTFFFKKKLGVVKGDFPIRDFEFVMSKAEYQREHLDSSLSLANRPS